ncbi:glucosamine-6-phosphate deaminase [Lactovum miscens]|uniref:Glucosamine-6-phosphate deaminase n=1 Tax=Lactovum miscens TaxID=190387 RepID=A0A841C7W7_9LACT|nr:glucosamine-6-phosphate deaminase [Lactovum miscens]MBB5888397.1 glucosamine-6-phosphate deaminase [Lactovum miscens]
MKIIKVKDPQEGGKVAFELFKEALLKGTKVLGLATGSTPVSFYNEVTRSNLDLSDLTSINLDEYVGLDGTSDQSYRYFMQKHLFDKKPFKETYVPNGKATNLNEFVKEYDKIIDEHPIDWQVLGLGQNGHIGFNEPGTPTTITTHVVNLAESTIKANARMFENESDVPRQAISMGIASIMKSKQLVVMAWGVEKADAVKGMIEGPVTIELPASILQTRDNVTVIVDEAAASKLSK